MNTTLQMRSKGTLVIRAELRPKYALSEGDGAFFLVPRVSLIPKLVAEMEAIRIEAGLTVENLLEGLTEQRQ